MTTKYRIYCTESGDVGWKYVWANSPPTECPNNVAHTVNSGSISEVSKETIFFRVQKLDSTNNTSYTRLATVLFDGSNHVLRRVKALSYCDSGVTSYDIQIYDATNTTELISNNFTNSSFQINDLGIVSSSPTTEIVLEVYAKKTGGNTSKYTYIDEIIFYCEGD